MLLTEHLRLPPATRAILWDMDGVLIDSLGLDIALMGPLFSKAMGREIHFTPAFIRSLFALDPARFVTALMDSVLNGAALEGRAGIEKKILDEFEDARRAAIFPLLPGVEAALQNAKTLGLRQAVVSNNPQADLLTILKRSGIADVFDVIVGNDVKDEGRTLHKKPAPDFYLFGMKQLGLNGAACAVFEDSVFGCQAGLAAGAHVVGLLTGSADEAALSALTPPPHQIMPDLLQPPLQRRAA